MNRSVVIFALDIPQGLIDAGDGAHVNAAAAIKTSAIHGLPQTLNLQRVFASQIIGQLVYRSGHRMGAPLKYWLTPADDAFVGGDFQKAPAGRNDSF